MGGSFEEYMDINMPTWKMDLNLEQIEDLKSSYNVIQKANIKLDDIFKQAYIRGTGAFNEEDLEKATIEKNAAKEELDKKIVIYKEGLNIKSNIKK